jgi:predicted HicB family RNase H-like nuclease
MKCVEENIELEESKKMVELSFDLDEKVCKMLEEMAKKENKSENEILIEAIEKRVKDAMSSGTSKLIECH